MPVESGTSFSNWSHIGPQPHFLHNDFQQCVTDVLDHLALSLKIQSSCATPWEFTAVLWGASVYRLGNKCIGLARKFKLGFLVRCHRKAQNDSWPTRYLLNFCFIPLHRISQVLQSHSQSCSVSYCNKAPEGAAKGLCFHFEAI